jgi:hypothetical protein
MMAPLDDRRVQIARLFGVTADAFAPIPEHRAATQATLDEAPGALAAADSALGETRTLLRSVRTFAQEAHRTLPLAPAGLRELRALLDEAPAPLDRANKLLAAAKPAVPGALAITTALAPVLRPARQLLDRVRPMLDTIAPHQCDIENFGAVFRDMTGYGSNAPGGPGGPPGEFRLQAVTPTGFENLGLSDPTGLTRREGYATPCQYLSEPYPILPSPGSLLGGLK